MMEEIEERLGKLRHTLHALYREFEMGISAQQLREALHEGFELVEEYPDDPRGRSCLLLCWIGNQPIHLVCAPHEQSLIVITVYRPETDRWQAGFKTRR